MPHRLELQLPIVKVKTTVPDSGLGKDQTSTAIQSEVISPAMHAINVSNNLKLQKPEEFNQLTLGSPSELRSE